MNINIDNAKILTIGDRAEDFFYISNASSKMLSDESCSELHQQLLEYLHQSIKILHKSAKFH
jgi:[protein-PII] uridylyltransferase